MIAEDLARTAHSVRHMARRIGVADPTFVVGAPRTPEQTRHAVELRIAAFRHNKRTLTDGEAERLGRLRSNPGNLGYFAGLLDGEGTITSHRAKVNHHLSLCNTDFAMIDWLLVNVGGQSHDRKVRQAHYRPQRQWVLTRTPYVIAILRAAMPYLITKRERAEYAIADFDANWSRKT